MYTETNPNSADTKSNISSDNNASTASDVNKPEPSDTGSGADNATLGADAGNTSTTKDEGDGERKILIKLKYLNDTLKEVEGSLDELLKDFKWYVALVS